MRRDSALSDSTEDVFDEDAHPSSPPVKTAPQKSPSSSSSSQPPAKKEEPPAKLVPAPPPKENIWEKRKTQTTGSPPQGQPVKESKSEAQAEKVPPVIEARHEPPAEKVCMTFLI